jgi:hypothetical protein
MKNLLFALLLLFSSICTAQSIVLDGKNGATTITPLKVAKGVPTAKTQSKTVGNASPEKKVVGSAALETYTFSGITLDYARKIKNSLLSVVYEETPNDLDNKAYLTIRDFINANKGFATTTKTTQIVVTRSMASSIMNNFYENETPEELKKTYEESLRKLALKSMLIKQVIEQEDAKKVDTNNRLNVR